MNNDTFFKFLVFAAGALAALIGFYAQIWLKQFEHKVQSRKENALRRMKFYLPLLRFCYELDGRIGRILSSLHTDWLSSVHLEKIRNRQGFAASPDETGYFVVSSIYVLASFFGWSELIKKEIDSTKKLTERNRVRKWLSRRRRAFYRLFRITDRKHIFHFDPDITTVGRLFQYEELFKGYMVSRKLTNPKDACKLHKQFQYTIGDLMLEKEDEEHLRCKNFQEFFSAYLSNEEFRYWLVPLENLLRDLSGFAEGKEIETQVEMKNDIRPLRLLAIRYWCRILMKNMSQELDIVTPPPDDALKGVSESLKKTIEEFTIEDVETYLLGIGIQNN